MKNSNAFDVMVVYSQSSTTSALSNGADTATPFPLNGKHAIYNDSYAYFLKICAKNNLNAAFTTSADVTGSGKFKSYWLFKNKKWSKIRKHASSNFIFDKFSPTTAKKNKIRKTLFSGEKVQAFNSPEIFSLFFDKQRTYSHLPRFAIPTVSIDKAFKKNVRQALSDLKKIAFAHHNCEDFSSKMVLKDRFGAGGNEIYSIDSQNAEEEICAVLGKNKDSSFVLQPFIKFDKGCVQNGYAGFVDVRVIYLGSKVIQSYIRTPKRGDFRCNVHQGGSIYYISPDKIPSEVANKSEEIIGFLDQNYDLFSLDFVISNRGNAYLVEGNCGVGINWDIADKADVRMAKKLIRDIVKSIKVRIMEQGDIILPGAEKTEATYAFPA